MQREYTTTFLGFTSDDVKDFVTIRRRFGRSIDMSSTRETELQAQEEKYRCLIKQPQSIEKQTEEIEQSPSSKKIIDQSETSICFPYQSLLNLRHWRKAPKSLKPFFQALTCLFPISNHDFFTELKVNHQLIHKLEFYQPSSIIMDEFRLKYSNLTEISPEYIRTKSFDAYIVAIWMHQIHENELRRNHSNRGKETHSIEQKIKHSKNHLHQTEKH